MAATQLTASPVTVSARSLASLDDLRASNVKFSSFGALKPGTLRQSQYRSLVVKAASVVAPKFVSLMRSWLNHHGLIENKENIPPPANTEACAPKPPLHCIYLKAIDETIGVNEEILGSINKVAELASYCSAREPQRS